jgi:hypothetical protein
MAKKIFQKLHSLKLGLMTRILKKYSNMVFTPPPLKHKLSSYNTCQGFDNEKKPLPLNFNVDSNEYVIRFREFISNLVNGREKYVNYFIAWIANNIQYPASRSQVCII